MELTRCMTVLIVVYFKVCESGGYGEKHHNHIKIHLPEFIHHDHHTKVITIHHHHKPKKEHHHHHHHHHHPKPHIPHHHHYNHHKTTLKTTTVSKGHGHHGHHKHHGYTGHHSKHHHSGDRAYPGHHNHAHHHHDAPTVNYDYTPPFEDDFKSLSPSVPPIVPRNPHVHGVVHTVKQVKVFDSLPGVLSQSPGGTSTSNGYEVTEEGEEAEDDAFTAINTAHETYPGTFNFVRNIAPQQGNPFADIVLQGSVHANDHDPFSTVPQPTEFSATENFSSGGQIDPFSTSLTSQGTSSTGPSEFTSHAANGQTFTSSYENPENNFVGNDLTGPAFFSSAESADPVSYSREAGIQQTVKTGGIETLVY